MSSIRYRKFKDDYNTYENYERVYCRNCGHSIWFKRNHQIACSWCGALVYPSKREEFKNKLKREMRKK